MITLITGTPGAGKTLYTVAEIFPLYAGREIFVDGIPDLLAEHQDPLGGVDEWHKWIPDNAVLVVDEVQRIWRPRGAGTVVPAGVAAMETHRHKGLDIVLITQHPNLLDANIRRLVGRHLHVRRVFGWGRAIVYEWDQATDPARVSTAVKRSWKYPRKSFSLYKSATAHQARHQKAPWALWFAGAALIGAPVLGYTFYERLDGKIGKPPEIAPEAQPGGLPAIPHAAASTGQPWEPEIFIPRRPDAPESAPAYDHLRQVKAMPQLAACVASADRCTCYTQQATRLDVPDDLCRDFIQNPRFNPYHDPEQADHRPTAKPALADGETDPPAEAAMLPEPPQGAAPPTGAGV